MIISQSTLTRAISDSLNESYDTLQALYSPTCLHATRDALLDRLHATAGTDTDTLQESIKQVELALQRSGWNYRKTYPITIRDHGHRVPQPIGFYL